MFSMFPVSYWRTTMHMHGWNTDCIIYYLEYVQVTVNPRHLFGVNLTPRHACLCLAIAVLLKAVFITLACKGAWIQGIFHSYWFVANSEDSQVIHAIVETKFRMFGQAVSKYMIVSVCVMLWRHSTLIFCFFRRREIEFALAHRRLNSQCWSLPQISFQDGGHSMSDYFSLKQFLHLCRRILPRFSVDFVFILLCTFLEVDLVSFFRATSLEMRYLDRWVFWISRWSNIEFYTLRTYKQYCLR
jgi:hypothetical protein